MTYKNDAILLRIHIIDFFCKLLGNICSVNLNSTYVTPVRLLKLPINTYFLALPTQQQVLTTIFQKLPKGLLPAIHKSIIKAPGKREKLAKIMSYGTRMAVLLLLLLNLNKFYLILLNFTFKNFYSWLWKDACQLGNREKFIKTLKTRDLSSP